MVMVPENPDADLFQVAEGFIQLIKLKQWSADPHNMMRVRIYEGIIKYLAPQTQYKLPYCITFVNGNDQIFIGNDEFRNKVNEMMDFCFA